jgi:sodium/potassium-transporting ATPase subunit alpha
MSLSYLFLGMIEAVYSLSLFFALLLTGGWRWGQSLDDSSSLYYAATGLTLSTIILMQIGNVAGRRSQYHRGLDASFWTNRLLLLGIVFEIFMAWGILYFPPIQYVLHTAPVSVPFFVAAWLGIPLLFGLDYLRKRFVMWRAQPLSRGVA